MSLEVTLVTFTENSVATRYFTVASNVEMSLEVTLITVTVTTNYKCIKSKKHYGI